MGIPPNFTQFAYVGPNNIDGVPVEQWQGKWSVYPSPYYGSTTYYYVTQVVGAPKLIYFNPYPSGYNNYFKTLSYSTDYDAWTAYVSPTVGCKSAPNPEDFLKRSIASVQAAGVNVDACNYVA